MSNIAITGAHRERPLICGQDALLQGVPKGRHEPSECVVERVLLWLLTARTVLPALGVVLVVDACRVADDTIVKLWRSRHRSGAERVYRTRNACCGTMREMLVIFRH